jgi:hypothetical protein
VVLGRSGDRRARTPMVGAGLGTESDEEDEAEPAGARDGNGDDLAAGAFRTSGREQGGQVETESLTRFGAARPEHGAAVVDREREREHLDPRQLVRGQSTQREGGG